MRGRAHAATWARVAVLVERTSVGRNLLLSKRSGGNKYEFKCIDWPSTSTATVASILSSLLLAIGTLQCELRLQRIALLEALTILSKGPNFCTLQLILVLQYS